MKAGSENDRQRRPPAATSHNGEFSSTVAALQRQQILIAFMDSHQVTFVAEYDEQPRNRGGPKEDTRRMLDQEHGDGKEPAAKTDPSEIYRVIETVTTNTNSTVSIGTGER